MIASLGDIVFEVSSDTVRTFKNLKYNVSAKYQNHAKLGGRPTTEYIGIDAESLTMTVKLSALHGLDPRKEMKKFNDACRKGTLLRFVLGNKKFGNYRWVITKVGNSIERIDKKGNILSVELSVTLSSYAKG